MNEAEEDDFANFVHYEQPRLFRTAYLLTGDYQRAEDVVQAAMTKVYLHWPRVRVMEQPGAYARRAVVNQTVSWWRRRSSGELPMSWVGDQGESADGADVLAERNEIWHAVRRLPPRQRAVIVLRFYEDLTEVEVAAALDISVGTVKSHSHTACNRLAEVLGEVSETSEEGQR